VLKIKEPTYYVVYIAQTNGCVSNNQTAAQN